MATYTIERVTEFTEELSNFLAEVVPALSDRFGNKLDWRNSRVLMDVFLVGRRNGEIRGVLIANLVTSVFDVKTKILRQQLFHVKPDSGRTAYHLFNKFIDIGRHEANHIITMLTSQTNIKAQTLENMGFKELETLYRLEV